MDLKELENEIRVFFDAHCNILQDCKQCGECCRDNNIFLTLEEVEKIKNYTKREEKEFCKVIFNFGIPMIEMLKRGDECIFLQNKKCAIHEVKPLQCKIYPLTLVLPPPPKEKILRFKCRRKDGMCIEVESDKFRELKRKREELLMLHCIRNIP